MNRILGFGLVVAALVLAVLVLVESHWRDRPAWSLVLLASGILILVRGKNVI